MCYFYGNSWKLVNSRSFIFHFSSLPSSAIRNPRLSPLRSYRSKVGGANFSWICEAPCVRLARLVSNWRGPSCWQRPRLGSWPYLDVLSHFPRFLLRVRCVRRQRNPERRWLHLIHCSNGAKVIWVWSVLRYPRRWSWGLCSSLLRRWSRGWVLKRRLSLISFGRGWWSFRRRRGRAWGSWLSCRRRSWAVCRWVGPF